MQMLRIATICSTALVGCTTDTVSYSCAVGLCTGASGHYVDPDVIDPETPAEIAAYPVYCRMTVDAAAMTAPEKPFLFRLHYEDPNDLSLFAYSDRGSDSMASFRRVDDGQTIRFIGDDGGDLPPDVLSIFQDKQSSFIAHTKRDYGQPAKGGNIVTTTYLGSCILGGNSR